MDLCVHLQELWARVVGGADKGLAQKATRICIPVCMGMCMHLQELWAHVVGGADKGLGHLLLYVQGPRDAKVAQLDNPVCAAEAVAAFKIPVDDTLHQKMSGSG